LTWTGAATTAGDASLFLLLPDFMGFPLSIFDDAPDPAVEFQVAAAAGEDAARLVQGDADSTGQ
jgi:hypothetical protein